MAYADASDVAVELGRPASSPAESAQWEAWLDRVERSIARRFVRSGLVLADQIALNAPASADVIDVEVSRVVEKINNPTGMTSITRSVDDASVTTRRDGAGNGDPLELSDVDWEALLPDSESSAFSTRPGFEPDGTTWPDSWI